MTEPCRSIRVRDLGRLFWKTARAATPWHVSPLMLCYVVVLILATDVAIWHATGSIDQFSSRDMMLYSLFSWPLWFILGSKGLAKEQGDLRETGRWTAIDCLPGGPTILMLAHALAKTVKSSNFKLWLVCYASAHWYLGGDALDLALAFGLVLVGAANLILGGILFQFLAPRGYANIAGGIFFNLIYLASGSVIPTSMISGKEIIALLNPFAAAISIPMEMLLAHANTSLVVTVAKGQSLAAAFVWMLVLVATNRFLEDRRREALHS